MIEGLGSATLAGVQPAAQANVASPEATAEASAAAEFAAILAGWLTAAAPPVPRPAAASPSLDGTTEAGDEDADVAGEAPVEASSEGEEATPTESGEVTEAGPAIVTPGVPIVGATSAATGGEETRVEGPSSEAEAASELRRRDLAEAAASRRTVPEAGRGGADAPGRASPAGSLREEALRALVGSRSAEAISSRGSGGVPGRGAMSMGEALAAAAPGTSAGRVDGVMTTASSTRMPEAVAAAPSSEAPAESPSEATVARAVRAITDALERLGSEPAGAAAASGHQAEVPLQVVPRQVRVEVVPGGETAAGTPDGGEAGPIDVAAELGVQASGEPAASGEEGGHAAGDGATARVPEQSAMAGGLTLSRSSEPSFSLREGPRGTAAAVPAEQPASDAPPRMVTLRFDGPDGLEQRIRVAVLGDSLRATILTDGRSAPLMERALPELQRSLAEHGFRDAQVGIRVLGGEAPVTISARQESAASGDPGRHREGQAGPDGRRRESAGEDRPRGQRHTPGEEAPR